MVGHRNIKHKLYMSSTKELFQWTVKYIIVVPKCISGHKWHSYKMQTAKQISSGGGVKVNYLNK